MIEIPFEYWNALANQTILVNSLLGGFSITIIASLIVSETNTRASKYVMIASTLAASFFLISLFAMTKMIMMTTDGYPGEVTQGDLFLPRSIGALFFFLGIFCLINVIALAGWTKSKKMGIFTTVVGVITLLFTIYMLT